VIDRLDVALQQRHLAARPHVPHSHRTIHRRRHNLSHIHNHNRHIIAVVKEPKGRWRQQQTCRPVGENSTARTLFSCPMSVLSSSPFSAFHTFTEQSQLQWSSHSLSLPPSDCDAKEMDRERERERERVCVEERNGKAPHLADTTCVESGENAQQLIGFT
jgi:hypothetical protein